MPSMDINADLGESFGNWVLGEDEALMPLITTANIACGYHGGDPLVMERTAALAREHVAARSHPGYPDLLGFGRRRYTLSPEEAAAYIRYQTGALIKQFHEVVADTGGTVIGFEVENEGAISPGDVVARIEPAD